MHVIGPEQGATLPGMTVVCGDIHTSTHGAFGALAHGIGTSEVEHVLATQTLLAKKAKNLLVKVEGTLPRGCTAKDIVLAIIGASARPAAPATRSSSPASAIRALSMEGRMTVCNMAIEAGARAGLVAVDETTIAYVQGPAVCARRAWSGSRPSRYWRTLAVGRRRSLGRAWSRSTRAPRPQVTWGTSPEMVRGDRRPRARPRQGEGRGQARGRSSARWPTWGWSRTRPIADIRIDKVFIGSCTNSRIEDLREAAAVVRSGRAAGWRPT